MKNIKPRIIAFRGNKKFTRLLAGEPQTCGMRSGYVELKPGEEVGEHITGHREEAIIILSGKAQVLWGKSGRALAGKNTLVYMPPEILHNVVNKSRRAILRYVYVVSPATIPKIP